MNDQKLNVMTQQQLDDLSKFSRMPIVMVKQQKIIYANDFFRAIINETDFDPTLLTIKCNSYSNHENEKQEISITNKSGDVYWFDCVAHDVIYQEQQATFAFLFDITVLQEYENSIMWTSKLQELIFNIFEHILDSTNLDEFFNFVLSKTLKATQNSTLGTILELKGDYLQPVASIGYDNIINSFKLPLEKSFLFTQTNGALDRIVNISNASNLVDYVPVKTETNDLVFIESVLSAPIHVNGEFYGTVNLDSIERDAFNDNDILALAFVRNTIEIAITNRLMYEEKVHLSYFDELTSLHNRYFFKENSDFVVKRANRYEEVFHLIMMDVDDLKKVNDTYGHLVGDKLIQLIARTINENIRDSDILARFGGDEFVGLAFNTTTKGILEKLTLFNEILKNSPIKHGQAEIVGSISYGIAAFPDDGQTIDELIQVADTRMYKHKNSTKKVKD